MRVYLASDHAGYELKERVKRFILRDYETVDWGNYVNDPNDDYPEFIGLAAKALSGDVANGVDSRAIIFGGSGQGEAIVANRYPGVRAIVYYGQGIRVIEGSGASDDGSAGAGGSKTYDIIALSREHNDANCLSIGARFVEADKTLLAITQWLNTPFSQDERHIRRIAQIDNPFVSAVAST